MRGVKELVQRIKSADVMRVFLLLIIFVCHAWIFGDSPTRTLVSRATGYALEIFFILSGCFVAIKYSQKEINARRFIKHEFVKFYPEFVFANLLSVFLAIDQAMFLEGNAPWKMLARKFIINISLLQSWCPTQEEVFALNGVGWFLSSLFFCYLLAPLAVKFVKKVEDNAVEILAACIMLRFIYEYTFPYWGDGNTFLFTNVFPPYRFFEFFAGICLGFLYNKHAHRRQNSIIQLSSILVWATLVYINANSTLILISELFLVYALVFYNGLMDKLGEWSFFAIFASVTMQFYLFHNPIIELYTWITWKRSIDIYEHGIITVLIVFAIALTFSYIVQYVRNMLRRISK